MSIKTSFWVDRIIVLISVATGVLIFHSVEHVIETTSGTAFEGWEEFFKWLRHLSSMGWFGVLAHALPVVLATVIVVVIERSLIGSKK